MRRVAAGALIAVMSGGALVGLAGQSAAAVPSNPIDPIVQVVQTAAHEVDVLMCELFGNTVLCGA